MTEQEFNLELAVMVRRALAEQERSVKWLARQTGIPAVSLYRYVRGDNPRSFSAFQLYRVCAALGWNIRDLFSGVAL